MKHSPHYPPVGERVCALAHSAPYITLRRRVAAAQGLPAVMRALIDANPVKIRLPMNQFQLHPVNALVCRVTSSNGALVGNLKLIGGVWKFKAIGVDAHGRLIPGGGPLTSRHNSVFPALDEAAVNAVLGAD